MIWSDGEGGTGLSGARENGGGDDVFNGFLDDTTHRAGAHLGIVALVNEDLLGFGSDIDGDSLGFKSLVGGSNNEV